jgi:hypothetical protein
MDLRSLSGHEGEDRVLWLRLLRRRLSQFLDRDGADGLEVFDRPLPFSAPFRTAVLEDLERARDLLLLLQQQGKGLLARSPAFLKEKFLLTWRRIHQMLSQSPRLGILGMLWLEKTQAEGQDLPRTIAVAERFRQLTAELEREIQ